jgi:two-component system response regulator YesN
MEQAVKLLTVIDDIKVNEVSEEVGYENVKHFLYVFKKHFGVTPSEYKSMNCK